MPRPQQRLCIDSKLVQRHLLTNSRVTHMQVWSSELLETYHTCIEKSVGVLLVLERRDMPAAALGVLRLAGSTPEQG